MKIVALIFALIIVWLFVTFPTALRYVPNHSIIAKTWYRVYATELDDLIATLEENGITELSWQHDIPMMINENPNDLGIHRKEVVASPELVALIQPLIEDAKFRGIWATRRDNFWLIEFGRSSQFAKDVRISLKYHFSDDRVLCSNVEIGAGKTAHCDEPLSDKWSLQYFWFSSEDM